MASAGPLVGDVGGAGGTMAVSPGTLTAGTTGVSLTLTYTAPDASVNAVTVTVPSGFPAPQSSSSGGAGYVSATVGSCAKAKLTITGGKVKDTAACPVGGSFTLTYANVTAPTTAAKYVFKTSAAGLGPVATQPAVKVIHGKASQLALSPGNATVEAASLPSDPPGGFWTDANPLDPNQIYTAETEDQYGNPVSNVTNSTGFAISPDGQCGLPQNGEEACGGMSNADSSTITATEGNFHATAQLIGGYGNLVMECNGENYDADGATANGCEVAAPVTGATTQGTAQDGGGMSDCNGTPASFSEEIISDTRVHAEPAVPGFSSITGSAPEWYKVEGLGNAFCNNDIVLTITGSGTGTVACYRLTVITDKEMPSVALPSSGSASIDQDTGGAFSDNTEIYFELQKTCTTQAETGVAPFSISYHF